MKIRLLILMLFVYFIAIAYGEQVKFVKNNHSYLVSCSGLDYDMLKGCPFFNTEKDSVITTAVDSVITVVEQSDSLCILIKKEIFIAYCYKQNGKYYLSDIQLGEYGIVSDFYCMDMNNDGRIDFVSVIADEDEYSVYIRRFVNTSNLFIYVFNKRFDHYRGNVNEQIKVKGKKIYVLYGHDSIYHEHQLMKYGVIDYVRDRSREIYFRPVSIITKKQWKEL